MSFPSITASKPLAQREHQTGSVSDRVRLAHNKLAQIVAFMMPGVLLSDPASKTGTTSAKTWRTEAFTFAARGLQEAKAAIETALTATTHDVAASKQAWYTLSIATGGTLTITKAADQTIGTDLLAIAPDNQIVVGYLKVVTTAAGAFDATTDDLAIGTNVLSVTFVDAPAIETIDVLQ
jgi:hypothetical protein